MSWDTLSWQPVAPETLDGAGALTHLAPMLRSALEEAASALAMGPVNATELSFAATTAADIAGTIVPASSIELLGTPRRNVWAAVEPAAPTLNGASIELSALAGALGEAFDAAFLELLGEGLSLAIATEMPSASATLTAFRLGLRDQAGTTVNVYAVVEDSVPTELATHVVALQALGADASKASGAPAGARAGSMSINDLAAQAEATHDAPSQAASPAPSASTAAHHAPGSSSPTPGGAGQPAGRSPAPAIRPFELDELPPVPVVPSSQNIELLMGVSLQVTVEIGRTKLAIRDVLALTPGSIVELDKLAGEKVDVLVNGQQIAQGEVVVVDENFGVRITDVVSRQRRILSADNAA